MTEYRDPLSSALPPETTTGFSEPVLTGAGAAPPSAETSTNARPMPYQPEDDPSMKDKAADSAQAGKQAVSEVAQTATDRAADVAQEAKAQARHLVGHTQDQLRQQASTQHRNLVTNLRSLGDQLNSMADRSEESGQATDLVAEAGSRAHSLASWLDEREPGQLLDELRSFARRKPGVFVLGALAAGVVAGRLTRGVVAVHQDDGDGRSQFTGGSAGYDGTMSRPYSTGMTESAAPIYPAGAAGPNEPLSGAYPTGAATAGEPLAGSYRGDPTPEVRP